MPLLSNYSSRLLRKSSHHVIHQCKNHHRHPAPAITTSTSIFTNHYHQGSSSSSDPISPSTTADPSSPATSTGTSPAASAWSKRNVLPGIRRIILIRHGQSLGNVDERAYVTTADWRIPLTDTGREQARAAGRTVASHLSSSGKRRKRKGGSDKVFFYVSPYLRTRQTLREMLREVDPQCVVGIREDPRIAEQQFGNFQSHGEMQDNKATRSDFGRFFYRFPDGGESGFDVYNRVSGFIGTMQRDSYQLKDALADHCNNTNNNDHPNEEEGEEEEGITITIITHGLAMRLFLMRWFQYTVHEFERSYNPENGKVVVLGPSLSPDAAFELSDVDRIDMGFPRYSEQERFQIMDDYSLLDKSGW